MYQIGQFTRYFPTVTISPVITQIIILLCAESIFWKKKTNKPVFIVSVNKIDKFNPNYITSMDSKCVLDFETYIMMENDFMCIDRPDRDKTKGCSEYISSYTAELTVILQAFLLIINQLEMITWSYPIQSRSNICGQTSETFVFSLFMV